MKKTIVQHCTVEQKPLFDLSRPFNQGYAARLGYDYETNAVRRCPDRTIWWEKIAYLRAVLPTLEEGSLVVWEDADSVNLKDESFEAALPPGGVLGMVQNRAGLGGQQLIPWYNAGVIVMRNVPAVRGFFDRVWARPEDTDEAAIVAELKLNGWVVGDAVPVTSIDPKWNCWRNNAHVAVGVVVQSWHGVPMAFKLPAMQKFIADNNL